MDQISALLPRFSFSAEVFYNGGFCGSTQFCESQGKGHLHFVRSGTVFMEHDDCPNLEIKEPTLVFYPQPFRHRLVVAPSSSAELLCAGITFKEARRNPFAIALPRFMPIPLKELNGLGPALCMLFAEASGSEHGKKIVMDRLCDVLIVQLIRYALKKSYIKKGVLAGLTNPAISNALAAIHNDPAHSWRLEELANLACMSRTKFVNDFRDLVGIAPGAYLIEWRMTLAVNLLRENRPVKEVAKLVGYSNQPAFSKAFSAYFAMPPTQWLKQS